MLLCGKKDRCLSRIKELGCFVSLANKMDYTHTHENMKKSKIQKFSIIINPSPVTLNGFEVRRSKTHEYHYQLKCDL